MTEDPNKPERHSAVPNSGAIPLPAGAVGAAVVVQEFKGLDAAKPIKLGRPKLPAGSAKGRIVHVRFTLEEIERITASAKASNKTISEWIRSTLNAAVES